LIPFTDGTYNLGETARHWNRLYLDYLATDILPTGNNSITLGGSGAGFEAIWLSIVGGTAAVELNGIGAQSGGNDAGASAVGIDASTIEHSTNTNLQSVLEDYDATIGKLYVSGADTTLGNLFEKIDNTGTDIFVQITGAGGNEKVKISFTGGGARQRACLDIVDGTASPPTEVSGDRYILDTSGTPIAAWDGAAENDIVEFNGSVWVADSPEEGWIAWVDAENYDYRFIDDGSPQWEKTYTVYSASEILTATGGFDRNLTTADTNVQLALNTLDELQVYSPDSVVVVPRVASDGVNYNNLVAAYAEAKALTPGGAALSATNRAVVIVPAGGYSAVGGTFVLDSPYVDVIGQGVCRLLGSAYGDEIAMPATRIYGSAAGGANVEIAADGMLLKGFTIHNTNAGSFTKCQIEISQISGAPNASLIDIALTGTNYAGVHTFSVGGTIACYMENVHSEFAGIGTFTGAGFFSSTCKDCSCSSGFGFSFTGGNITNGHYERCVIDHSGFAFSLDSSASFAGVAIDCKAPNGSAFACSESSGLAEFQGTCLRCHCGDDSFGHGGTGSIFKTTGVAIDCSAEENSFGSTAFQGFAKKCSATSASFGGSSSGANTGQLDECYADGGAGLALRNWQGRIIRGEYTSTQTPIRVILATAKLESVFLNGGSGFDSVSATSAASIAMSFCKMRHDIDTDVTNLVLNGYNIIDPNL
jgi:hypothetical protein